MFASNLFRDEVELRQFLTDVELDLREGRSHDAIERVDFALGVLEEFDHPIAAMCRAHPPSAIRIHGWDKLATRLFSLDQPDRSITAISIDLSSHGDFHANVDEAIAPYLETSFYSDNAFAFSNADRATICARYGTLSSDWAGNFEHADETIKISGIGRLNFAIEALDSEHRLERSDDPLVSDAMVFAVAYRAVAVHHAVRTMLETHGLPRPLTVLVGSHDSYPFFNAPVITAGEYSERTAGHDADPAPELTMADESTVYEEMPDKLIVLEIPVEEATAVEASVDELTVDELTVDEAIVVEATIEPKTEEYIVSADIPDHTQFEQVAPIEVDPSAIDEDRLEIQQDMARVEPSESMPQTDQYGNPDRQLSGSEIRRRFAEPNIAILPQPKSGLLNRIFGRS